MPPKTKYTVDDIVDAAFNIVRKNGLDKLTARNIADDLKSSTMPIYSCGKSMQEIEEEVIKKAWYLLAEYQRKKRSNDVYLDLGLGYIMFAKEENHLLNCIKNPKHETLNTRLAEENFLNSFAILSDYPLFEGITDDAKLKIMTQGWIYSHGFANLLTNGYGNTFVEMKTEEQITAYFLEATQMYWAGLERFVKENQK